MLSLHVHAPTLGFVRLVRLLGCSKIQKVEKLSLQGHFPMRLIRMSLEIRILGF